ncbi:MAG: nucleotidyltransferase family protein [Bacteroidetes bacterium]|nr:nucleotidyltransferase family protein [Bacteroidota bacterium]
MSAALKSTYCEDFVNLTELLAFRLGNTHHATSYSIEHATIVKHKLQLFLADQFTDSLQQKITADSRKAFRQQKTLLELNALFQQNQLSFLLLKGLALNQILHGNKLCRPSLDIDLLIAPNELFRINNILLAAGWKRTSPEFEIKENQKEVLIKNFDQFLYHHPEKKVNLEIHWRLFRNNYILPLSFQDIWKEKQTIKIGNTEFSTMGNAQYLAYLLLHGFQHAWERLMWLVDLDILVKKSSEVEINNLIRLSEKHGFDKQLSITFALLEDLLKTKNYSSEIKNKITFKSKEKARSLILYIPGSIDPPINRESVSYKLKRLAVEVEHSGSFRARLFYLYNYPFFMYKYVSLPATLSFLYPLFWPYVFVRNKVRNKN